MNVKNEIEKFTYLNVSAKFKFETEVVFFFSTDDDDWKVHDDRSLPALERRIEDILQGLEACVVPDEWNLEDPGSSSSSSSAIVSVAATSAVALSAAVPATATSPHFHESNPESTSTSLDLPESSTVAHLTLQSSSEPEIPNSSEALISALNSSEDLSITNPADTSVPSQPAHSSAPSNPNPVNPPGPSGAPGRRSSRLEVIPEKEKDAPPITRQLTEDFMFVPTGIPNYR